MLSKGPTRMAATFPRIIYGTAWKKERTSELVVQAALQGFRAIDTACQPKHYQEALVGDALQKLYDEHGLKREDFFLQTKFTSISGQDLSKPLPYDPKSSVTQQVRDSFATSLRQLRTEYLDSYILHSPLQTNKLTVEAWKVLMSLQDEGKVRLIGVSNTYDVETLKMLVDFGGRKIDVVQNRWFEGNGWDAEVVEFCRKEGIHYQSFWTLSGSPSLLRSPTVVELAKKKDCTEAQILFRAAQLWGITPLAGSKNQQRMKDGVEAGDIEMDGDEAASIKRVMKTL